MVFVLKSQTFCVVASFESCCCLSMQVKLSVSLDADLRQAFNWNTKQIFVFLQAEYETKTNWLNQVSMWDQIVLKKVTRCMITFSTNN